MGKPEFTYLFYVDFESKLELIDESFNIIFKS